MKLKIKKLDPRAITPSYATAGAACFDLYAIVEEPGRQVLYRDHPTVFRTGLAFEVPEGHVMLIFSRSGHGFNNDTRLANCVGVIDSDYRGEMLAKLNRDSYSGRELVIRDGDRVAQAMVMPVEQVRFQVVDELGATARGDGAFGSTGA